jgi:hypothetical protein
VAAVQEVLVATGAVDEVEHRIATLTVEAVAVAKELAVDEEAQVELVDLATYVAWRDH